MQEDNNSQEKKVLNLKDISEDNFQGLIAAKN